MKKVGIITWCDNNGVTNYGQVLQCYAMQKACEKLGKKTIVLQYRKRTTEDFCAHSFQNNFFNQVYESAYKIFVREKKWNKRIANFRKFIYKYIHLSYPCYSIEDLTEKSKDCYALLCGSDQIWNPRSICPAYALQFGNVDQLRIAYAPSGVAQETQFAKNRYKELAAYIENFDAVSVREKRGAEILRKYTNKAITDVMDPTFLLSSNEWEDVMTPRLIKEPYIFCYALGEFQRHKRFIKPLMNRYGVEKVVYIPSNLVNSVNNMGSAFIPFESAGPAEFLSLIRHASMVCTDSFHGMALSINFGRQFCVLSRIAGNSATFASEDRQNNILEKAGLKNRVISCLKDINTLEDIDYSVVHQKLKKEITDSWEFLQNALN